MNASRRRAVLWIVGIAAVVILLVALAEREPPPNVTVAQAHRENLSASISSNGKVEPITPHVLRAKFNTFVKRVAAVEGQKVTQGQLLVELDAEEARAALARAREDQLRAEEDLRAARAGGKPEEVAQLESDLRKAAAELTRLRAEREALERLLAKQAATRDEVDQNKLALERAEAQGKLLQQRKDDLARRSRLDVERATLAVERAHNEVRQYQEQVQSASVVAPVDGTAYSLPVRTGDFVRVGDLLAEVADLRRVRVRVFVDEPDIGWLEAGQGVEITWDAMPGRVWNGKAEHVPQAVVVRGTRSVGEVLCSVENEKLELLPNINVNVQIRVRERTNALVVPRAAVRVDGAKRVVFVVDGRTLRRREVRVGIAGATSYEILEGLAEGDRVALPGETELRDGLTVVSVEGK
jgi:multidrug efflux pump subunit AcrA (membrane-fusion protein)